MTPGRNAIKVHPYFSLREFDCRGAGKPECACNGAVLLTSQFLDRLVIFRRFIDVPVVLERGYSCPSWNAHIGGKDYSKHTLGMAGDWNVYNSGFTEKEACQRALASGLFTGIGVYGRSYRDPATKDIVFNRGYKNKRGMIHLEYCEAEDSGKELGKTELYRQWGDWSDD